MASQAIPPKVKVYLSFFDASGYQSRLEQLQTGSLTTPVRHFLANQETDGPLFVIGHKDDLHSHACINVYATTVTLCVFEELTEGTWVLPSGWHLGSSNILDRLPMQCSSNERESVIQLRPGDQILLKGGRFSIDFFMRQCTPSLPDSLREKDDCLADTQTGVSQRSHYSQLNDVPDSCPTTPSLDLLHYLLEMNEPARAISWSKAAYVYEENQTVLQVSVCKNYRSTFEAYGSLISPLILLKAVKYAYPLATVEKKLENENEYVVRGIRPREEQLGVSYLMAQDQAEVTTRPRLREIYFDSEAISPDILEGMETPAWKIMEDSQALLSSHFCNGIDLVEDREAFESPMIAPDAPISEGVDAATGHVGGTSSDVPESRTSATEGLQTHDTRGAHTLPLGQSPPRLEVSDDAESHNELPVKQVSRRDKEHGSPVLGDESDDEAHLGGAEYNVEDDAARILVNQEGKDHTPSLEVEPTTIANASDGNTEIRNAQFLVEEHANSKTRGKKRPPSREASMPRKKMKTSHQVNLTDMEIDGDRTLQLHDELDGDTIVVESESFSNEAQGTNPGCRSRSRGSDISSLSKATVDSVTPPHSSRRQTSSSQRSSISMAPTAKPSRQYPGDPPRVMFSSSTEIDGKKNTMAFLRKCGGKLVKHITSATMLCVASDQPLKKTANLVLAICMGLDIVTEAWLVESQRKGVLLDTGPYLPKDSQRESEWRFKLDEALARGKKQGAMTYLLAGTDVYFLQGLKSLLAHNFRDFTKVATCLGADAVRNGLPKGKAEKEILILGVVDDPQSVQASEIGHEVWSKDLLVMGALRGTIERTDEFTIAKPMKHEGDS